MVLEHFRLRQNIHSRASGTIRSNTSCSSKRSLHASWLQLRRADAALLYAECRLDRPFCGLGDSLHNSELLLGVWMPSSTIGAPECPKRWQLSDRMMLVQEASGRHPHGHSWVHPRADDQARDRDGENELGMRDTPDTQRYHLQLVLVKSAACCLRGEPPGRMIGRGCFGQTTRQRVGR